MSISDESNNKIPKEFNGVNGVRNSYDDKSSHAIDPVRRSSIVGGKSPGVARIEAVSSVITRFDRIFIFFGVFLIAFCYALDGTLRYAYQPTATASFATHSLLATVNVLRAVIAAAAQPTSAKIADIFGRVELIVLSVFFYTLGTVIEAVSTNVRVFCAGAVIYQVGYTMVVLLVEVIVADITSTRARLLFSYIPATPFLITTWVSGDISQAVLLNSIWQWGIGMWCIIYPVCALPLILSLWLVGRRAKRQGKLDSYTSSFAAMGWKDFLVELFWRLDTIGIILMIAVFALILVPLTLAGGFVNQWHSAHIIAPLVVGICCIPAFIIWELKAPHPLVPFSLMKDRGVWAPMGIALFVTFPWYLQGDYLYTVLIVSFGFSIKAATRVSSLYSFTSVLTGCILGFVVYKVRRLKMFIVFGTCLYLVAFGLLINYRGSSTASDSAQSGVIGAQVLLGMAGGMFPYPAQASLQVNLKHEHLAVMTGLYLATYNIGSALGNTVSGSIWTQVLPSNLEKYTASTGNTTLAAAAYANPFSVVYEHPIGSPERTAIIDAYRHTQRLLCITGACLCIPLIVFACFLRNPKLNDKQTLAVEDEVALDEAANATTVR